MRKAVKCRQGAYTLMKKLNIIAAVRIFVILLGLTAFALIEPQSIENTSFCMLYRLTGAVCPGCGSSRALNNLLHLNFQRALAFNPVLTLFVFPAFAVMLINDIYVFITRLIKKQKKYSFIEYLFIGLWEV